MQGRVTAVRHMGISVADLEKSLNFYQRLGLTVKSRADESGGFLEEILGLPGVRVTTVKLAAEGGPTLVELLRYDEPRPAAGLTRDIYEWGPSHLALTVADLDGLYDRLTRAGVPFRSAPRLSADGLAKVAFCADPDGTPVELVEPC